MKGICKRCNIIYDYIENCPHCGSKTIFVDKIYENKQHYQILLSSSIILAPFASSILFVNNPTYSYFVKIIGTIALFIWGFMGYISFSQILESHVILFYLYQIINLIIVFYLLKHFYYKFIPLTKILSAIYIITISIPILINSLNFYDRDSIINTKTDNNTTINSIKNQPINIPNNNKTISTTEPKTQSSPLKMPPLEIVDSKLGSHLKSFAVYYEDQSRENIILAAKCWNRQKGTNNIFVYFVNDKSYRIDNRRTETEKVTAFYESTVNGSTLYFLNPDGTAYETMNID